MASTAGIAGAIWALFQWLVPDMPPEMRVVGWIAMAVLAVLFVQSIQHPRITAALRGASSVVAVLLVALCAWRFWPVEAEAVDFAAIKKQLEANLWLEEMYPHYYWVLSPGGRTERVYRLDDSTLTSTWPNPNGHRLTLLIHNGNNGIPLFEPEMQVGIQRDVIVAPPKMWRRLDPRPPLEWWWASRFAGSIQGNDSSGIDESLYLTFERRDVYPVIYVINGRVRVNGNDISLERRGSFWMRLEAPTP